MKQKKIALMSLAAVAALSLASCGSNTPEKSTSGNTPTTQVGPTGTKTARPTKTESTASLPRSSAVINSPEYPTDTKGLDIALNYQAKQGITLRDDQYVNTAEGKTYVQDDLLPTWTSYQTTLKTKIRDASAYDESDATKYYTKIKTDLYKSQKDASQNIDLFYNTTTNINEMGTNGEAVDLLTLLDYMPNFAKFLQDNPTIKKQLTKNGHIFYTPYFDGYNAVERMHVMDTNMAIDMLDSSTTSYFDYSKNGKGADANALQAPKLTPFIDPQYNYPNDNQEVKISYKGEVKTIKVKRTTNIIKQQNELLKNGCTGKDLADQLRAYLREAYGAYIGEGKYFPNLSDIFISEQAAYNTDELLALMRVVKANPGVITGDSNAEVEVFVVRGAANNRVQNVYHLLNIFGIQGIDGEKEGLFFDANGKINDAYALNSTYEALENVSAMYDEGLILGDFFSNSKTGGTTYLDTYFGKTAGDGGYGFMLYDYSASTGAVNSKDSLGIGTANSKRVGAYKNTVVDGVMPVLPPVTWWATEKTWDYEQALSDHTGMTLIRRSTSNRALKSDSWCIPTTSDNKETAARLMDYMFSEEGSLINDFGPRNTNYWKSTTDFVVYGGQATPEFSDALKEMIGNSGTDFWSFMRGKIGSTHGVGYVRSASINYLATNTWAKVGTVNIETAIANGVVCLDKVDKHGATEFSFDNSVPSAGYGSETAADKPKYAAITEFWSANKYAATATGWVKVVVDPVGTYTKTSTAEIGKNDAGSYSYKDVFDQFENRITMYLYTLVDGYNSDLVPDYAQ